MVDRIRVAGVVGSRRSGSYTRTAVNHALTSVEDSDVTTDLIDLGDPTIEMPLYHPDQDVERAGDVADLLARMRKADGAILGSPVYHNSYSSTWRNFHDYCSFDEFEDTAVGLVCVAGGGSFGSTLEHMRSTVRGVHGWTVPRQVGIRSASSKIENGVVTDEDIADRLANLAEQVLAHSRRLND
ncbi:MAG: NADPH-dependent FMN reductase [Halobacteriaceae archaeon]